MFKFAIGVLATFVIWAALPFTGVYAAPEPPECAGMVFDRTVTLTGAQSYLEPFYSPGRTLVLGGTGNNLIQVQGANDCVVGGDGNDSIYISTGNYYYATAGGLGSVVVGGNGNDLIYGSYGRDKLYGGPGDDTLSGHFGNDIVDGGAGVDTVDGGGLNFDFDLCPIDVVDKTRLWCEAS